MRVPGDSIPAAEFHRKSGFNGEEYFPIEQCADENVSIRHRIVGKCAKKWASRKSPLELLYAYVPIIYWIPRYDFCKNALRDLIAGLTVGTLAVPQALGYGVVAGVGPINGLYTSFIPPLIYTVLGTSRHVSVGTFALVALMTGEAVSDVMQHQEIWNPGNGTEKGALYPEKFSTAPEVASTLALVVGVWQLLLGMLNLGALTMYLSDRVVKGFACGAAMHIFATQLRWLFGLSFPKSRGHLNLLYTIYNFCRHLPYSHLPTCAVSGTCVIALLIARYINQNARIMKVIRFQIPMELFVIIFGSLASYLLDLHPRYNIDIVKTIPLGVPHPHLPRIHLLPEIWADALMIAVISFSMAISAGRLFAQKHNYKIDSNQELRALGVANVCAGFFQCFPSSVALARSLVQESAGGVTQVVSVIMAGVVLLVITVLGPFLEPLPKACLGSIIVVALLSTLMGITDVARLWRISKTEAMIFLVPFVCIVILDVEIGLLIGVVFSLIITVVIKSQRNKIDVLGIKTDVLWRDQSGETADISKTHEMDGVRVLRLNVPLYFANSEIYLSRLLKMAFAPSLRIAERKHMISNGDSDHHEDSGAALMDDHNGNGKPINGHASLSHLAQSDDLPEPMKMTTHSESILATSPPRVVVLDMVAVHFLDISGIEALRKLKKECESRSCVFYLAACPANVRKVIERYEAAGAPGQNLLSAHIVPTISVAADIAKGVSKATKETTS